MTGFFGFGRCQTDKQGGFSFVTIKPGRVPGPGNSLQAPHLLATIFMRGLLRHLVTRVYFADEAQAIKNPGAKQAKALKAVKRQMARAASILAFMPANMRRTSGWSKIGAELSPVQPERPWRRSSA